MDGEDKKVGLKKRSKVVEINLDSEDDEPIVSLFKLKSKRKTKKVKLGSDGGEDKKGEVKLEKAEVGDEDLRGMEDTLASFRKKLKGPKKDGGDVTFVTKGSDSNLAEVSTRCLKKPLKDEGFVAKLVQDAEEEGGDMTSDVSISHKSEKKHDRKPKRFKSTKAAKSAGVVNADDVGVADASLSENQMERQEGLSGPETKCKKKSKRSKFFSDANNLAISVEKDDVEVPNDCALGDREEGLPSPSDEILADSLSSFLKKAQSGLHKKSRASQCSKARKGEQVSENDHCPSSDGVSSDFQSTSVRNFLSDSKVHSKSQISEGHLSGDGQICSSASLDKSEGDQGLDGPCGEGSSYIPTGDATQGVTSDSVIAHGSPRRGDNVGDTSGPALEQSFPVSVVLESNCCLVACSEKITEMKSSEVCLGHEVIHEGPLLNSSDKFCDKDGDESPSPVPKVEKQCASGSQKAELRNEVGHFVSLNASSHANDFPCSTSPSKSVKELSEPDEHDYNISSDDECIQHDMDATRVDSLPPDQNNGDDASLANDVNDGANGMSSPSVTPDENGGYQEDGGCFPETNDKYDSLVVKKRAIRKVRKRKDGDMAYEGDADWKVVMHEQGFLDSHSAVDRDQDTASKERLCSSSDADVDLESGGAAAVSVGLKAHAGGPVEKIKFKEVLKSKAGLQEYLDCRNKILSLWSKDVTRILPLVDCGVTTTPTDGESPHDSLMRDVYLFLDQSGYINTGIAANKEKAEPNSRRNYKLLGEKNFEGNSGASVADSADGVSFILGQIKSADTLTKAKDDVALEDENHFGEDVESGVERVVGPIPDDPLDKCPGVEEFDNQCADVRTCERIVESDHSSADLLGKSLDSGTVPSHATSNGRFEANDSRQVDVKNVKKILVVGAGPAGLTAARHLQRQGFSVTVLEARSRIGGRVYTDHSSLSVPVDLGASIITGVEADVAGERRPDPSSLICAQLGLELTILNSDCPLYDIITGQKVLADVDEALEAEFNSLVDDMALVVAQKGESAMRMSLEDGLEYGLKRRRKVLSGSDNGESDTSRLLDVTFNHENSADGCHLAQKNDVKDDILGPLERRVMDWHFAHLEYGCAALLKDVSLPHWNQDDVYGGFGGAHCMIKGGYSAVVESIARGLSIHLNQVVADISYSTMDSGRDENCSQKVKISTSNGNEFYGDAVLITVPLGCLKAGSIKFSPPLPQWKHSAIQRLGFGVLNKVVLEFPEVFWNDTVDYFGATAENTELRGRCFMFWNVKKTVGAPVLIALVVGKAAIDGQNVSSSDHVNHALKVLRKLFGDTAVPDPVASVVTDWGRDPFSYGAYSYVAVGSSGEDYDILGRPVENCLFFAGEATCKEHPDTVGGAMMSGLREAVRIVDILTTGSDYTAEADAIEAAQRQSNSEKNEVKDIARRLDAVALSTVRYNGPSDGSQSSLRESLLKDMFFTAKTFAGRLRLAKELLRLPVDSLKSFAGTKDGLSIFNSWILDSMGKDGTQLLRHCVRILVLVSTDLVAVRLSGIGKTIKQKVCVHTSRDIRGIASQLVHMWIEVFRKKKAASKLLRHKTNAASSRVKRKDPHSRKPPIRVWHRALGNKANLSSKKPTGKQVKHETVIGSKTDTSSLSQFPKGEQLNKVEESEEVPLSEEERAAIAAAEAAQAAALAAAEAYASTEARCSMMQLPKIPSFQKFARREQYALMDDTERRKWSGGVLGRQDCISEIDSRNCRVRDWSVDFSATCANLDNSRMSADNLSQRSNSNDMACQLNWREHSGESAAGDSTAFTRAWVDSSGSVGIKDYHAIERWQCQAAAAEYEFQSSMHIKDEEDSSTMSRLLTRKHEGVVNESSVSQVTVNKELTVNQRRGAEHIKQGVVDYVASLLMPLYKARKIDRDGYKSIMKKSATKVMEQTTDAEKAMAVSEFLDFKRKNKIRAFVDNLIDRHMSTKPVMKP